MLWSSWVAAHLSASQARLISVNNISIFTLCAKMIDAVWKLIIFVNMLNRFTKTSGNERVTLWVYKTDPTSFRYMHPWSHGTYPSGSLILATFWSACLVWWSSQKLHQMKMIGLHFHLFRNIRHTVIVDISNSRLAWRTDCFRLRRKDYLTGSTLPSDTRWHPPLSFLQRHPVVGNCWYKRLMLLADGPLWS
jgi:hypothetical protein